MRDDVSALRGQIENVVSRRALIIGTASVVAVALAPAVARDEPFVWIAFMEIDKDGWPIWRPHPQAPKTRATMEQIERWNRDFMVAVGHPPEGTDT